VPDVFLRSVPSDADRDDVRLYDPTTADASGVIGTAAQTLDSVTQSSAGTLTIKGTTAQTISAFVQATTGKVLIKGTTDQTLGAFTQASAGTVSQPSASTGSASQTLGAFTQSAPATMSQPPSVEQPPDTGSTGGGGAAQWYRGKYRNDIRKAILAAAKLLPEKIDKRKRKRVARKVAKAMASEPLFIPVQQIVVADVLPLELVRLQISLLATELKDFSDKKAKKLTELLAAYDHEVKALDRRDEEEAIAIILAIAA